MPEVFDAAAAWVNARSRVESADVRVSLAIAADAVAPSRVVPPKVRLSVVDFRLSVSLTRSKPVMVSIFA
ncbi:hypothetical protein D3C72_2442330 [compost metagenome]